MQLNLNDENQLENPDPAAVAEGLRALELETFAVLSRADEDYIQVYRNEDGSYQLEYRAGSYEKHFEAANEEIGIDEVVAAFNAFMTGGENWQQPWDWNRIEFDEDFEGGHLE